jgi:hypothetical protein
MEETPPADIGSKDRELAMVAGLFDAPAYIRRARGVEEALAFLVTRCRKKRDELLIIPRQRLAALAALAGQWEELHPLLLPEDVSALKRVHEELAPPPAPLAATILLDRLRKAIEEVASSFGRFNAAWLKHLREVDLSGVNDLRDRYNRYYVIEKACAMRSDLLARQGFSPLPMMTADDLIAMLPPLPVPRVG